MQRRELRVQKELTVDALAAAHPVPSDSNFGYDADVTSASCIVCVVRKTKFRYTPKNKLEAYLLAEDIFWLVRLEDGVFELMYGRFARTDLVGPDDARYQFFVHETTLEPGQHYEGPPFDPVSRQKREEIWLKNKEWRNAKFARIERRKVADRFGLERIRRPVFNTFELGFLDPAQPARIVKYPEDDDFEFLHRHALMEDGQELIFKQGLFESIKRRFEFLRPGAKSWLG